MRFHASFLGSIAALSLFFTNVFAGGQTVDYAELARRYQKKAGIDSAEPGRFDFAAHVARAHLHARLGVFDLSMPFHEAGEEQAKLDFQAICLALIDLQTRWLDWIEPAAAGLPPLRADAAAVRDWIRRWKPNAPMTGSEETELLGRFGAETAVREASERFARSMTLGEPLGITGASNAPEPLILIRDRTSFVELACFSGSIYPDARANFWRPDCVDWTYFDAAAFKVIALQFSAGASAGDYGASLSMKSVGSTVMLQQVVQLAANSLIDHWYGERVPAALAGSLSLNLVVDLYSDCDTRNDGDLRQHRTAAVEVFVPGGNPEGGTLAAVSAKSRWRQKGAADRFAGALRGARKDPGRVAGRKAKRVGFEIENDSRSDRQVVVGPFLGSAAQQTAVPPREFLGDYFEFLRSYRACFVWWLREKSLGDPKKSSAAFARWLHGLARIESASGLEPAVTAAFGGAPLSSADDDPKALEVSFQKWLAK